MLLPSKQKSFLTPIFLPILNLIMKAIYGSSQMPPGYMNSTRSHTNLKYGHLTCIYLRKPAITTRYLSWIKMIISGCQQMEAFNILTGIQAAFQYLIIV